MSRATWEQCIPRFSKSVLARRLVASTNARTQARAALVATSLSLIFASSPAVAAPTTKCPVGDAAYSASPVILTACGERLVRRQSTHELADGGTSVTFALAKGAVLSYAIPPAGFRAICDPCHAVLLLQRVAQTRIARTVGTV